MGTDSKPAAPQPPSPERVIENRFFDLACKISPMDESRIQRFLAEEIARAATEVVGKRQGDPINERSSLVFLQTLELANSLQQTQTVNSELNNGGFLAGVLAHNNWSGAINNLLERFLINSENGQQIDSKAVALYFSLHLLRNRTPILANRPIFETRFARNDPDQPLLNMLYLLKNMGVISDDDIDQIGITINRLAQSVDTFSKRNDIFVIIENQGLQVIGSWVDDCQSFVREKIGYVGYGGSRDNAFLGKPPNSSDVADSFYGMSGTELDSFVEDYFANKNTFGLEDPKKKAIPKS